MDKFKVNATLFSPLCKHYWNKSVSLSMRGFTGVPLHAAMRSNTLAVHQRIAHKIHRPAQVDGGLCLRRAGRGCSGAVFFCAACSTASAISPIDALMVPSLSLSTQQGNIFGKSVVWVASVSSRRGVTQRMPLVGVGL